MSYDIDSMNQNEIVYSRLCAANAQGNTQENTVVYVSIVCSHNSNHGYEQSVIHRYEYDAKVEKA